MKLSVFHLAIISSMATSFTYASGCNNDYQFEIGGYQLGAKQSLASRVSTITDKINKEQLALATLQKEFELNLVPTVTSNNDALNQRTLEVSVKLKGLCTANSRSPIQERAIVLYGKQLASYNAINGGHHATDSLNQIRKTIQNQRFDLEVIKQELGSVTADSVEGTIDLACNELGTSKALRLQKVEPLRNQFNGIVSQQKGIDPTPEEVCQHLSEGSLTPDTTQKVGLWHRVKAWFN